MRRVPPEVVRFLQAQQRVLAVLQSGQRGNRAVATQNLTPDEEMGDMTGMEAVDWDTLVEVRDGDNSDLVRDPIFYKSWTFSSSSPSLKYL